MTASGKKKAKKTRKASSREQAFTPGRTAEDIRRRAVRAALDLAAQRGWENISLHDISRVSDLSLAQLYDHFEDKADIIGAFARMIDKQVMEAASTPGEGLSPRDALFDLLMERFDLLNEHRAGVCSVLRAYRFDPKEAFVALPHLGRSMGWMLEAAGIDTLGLQGTLRIIGLTAVYLKALKSWLDDDSADMGKTMATLDQALGQAEKFAQMFGL